MLNITIDDLLENVAQYNIEEVENVRKAYNYAKILHSNQVRQSGEPYIIHPLNVAYILTEMHADGDTICAGLLHDTLEDTNITKNDLIDDFNYSIANLVDGVTKMEKENFSTKQAQNMANTRKIITGITNDVRIIFVKLADRLHNMRTLQFKSLEKQKENAIETLEIFVPLAYYVGAYKIKTELEDLSLSYIDPDIYKIIEDKKEKIKVESFTCLNEMNDNINEILLKNNIENEINVRMKNIYGIYKKLCLGKEINDIHDLLSLKIIVKEIKDCYYTLGLVHEQYHPINGRFKDYICNPKVNMYSSLHSTVFGPLDKLVQTQIKTHDMNDIATYGLAAYWNKEKGNARNIMQEDLKNKFQFYKSLKNIDNLFIQDEDFVLKIKQEVFSDKIYVYTPKGDIIELPIGATALDFAYQIHTEIGDNMIAVVINDKLAPINSVLKNNDRIKVITDNNVYRNHNGWYDIAKTSYAKEKIKLYNKKQNFKEY